MTIIPINRIKYAGLSEGSILGVYKAQYSKNILGLSLYKINRVLESGILVYFKNPLRYKNITKSILYGKII